MLKYALQTRLLANTAARFETVERQGARRTNASIRGAAISIAISGAGGNIGVQTGPDGVLLVNTGTQAAAGDVLAAIQKLTKESIRYIINTGADADLVGGNQALSKAGLTSRQSFGILGVATFALAVAALSLAGLAPEKNSGGEGRAKLVASPEADWPQFRGPRRDGICDERGLLAAWPDTGLKLVWAVTNIARGYSSPVIANGRFFITGDAGEELHIFAFDLEGHLLWRATNGQAWKDPYPGARSSVTYSAGRVYHENAHGH